MHIAPSSFESRIRAARVFAVVLYAWLLWIILAQPVSQSWAIAYSLCAVASTAVLWIAAKLRSKRDLQSVEVLKVQLAHTATMFIAAAAFEWVGLVSRQLAVLSTFFVALCFAIIISRISRRSSNFAFRELEPAVAVTTLLFFAIVVWQFMQMYWNTQ